MLKATKSGTGFIGIEQQKGIGEFQKTWNAGRFRLAQKASTWSGEHPLSTSSACDLPAHARQAADGSSPGFAASRGRPPHAASSVCVQLFQHQHVGSPWQVHMPSARSSCPNRSSRLRISGDVLTH